MINYIFKTRQLSSTAAFALPTVLIVSVVLMVSSMAILQNSLSTKIALDNQQYERLAREAAESGIAHARSCVAQGALAFFSQWSPRKLTPNTSCFGITQSTSNYLIDESRIQTTYTTGVLSLQENNSFRITSEGMVDIKRTSGAPIRIATQSVSQTIDSEPIINDFAYAEKGFRYISAGDTHSCGISSGKAYCWGNNSSGQLGDGTTISKSIPTPVAAGSLGDKTVTAISAGGSHTCAIADGLAYCWGNNSRNQASGNTDAIITSPTLVSSLRANVTSISAGLNFTCAVGDTYVWCWGDNTSGQVFGEGYSTTAPVNFARAVLTTIDSLNPTKVSSGSDNACAIVSGNAYCWGRSSYGEIGNGIVDQGIYPVTKIIDGNGVIGSQQLIDVSISVDHACAVSDIGNAFCWGRGNYGQLGNTNNQISTSYYPLQVSDISGVTSIATGASPHTCAVATGKAYCWGRGSSGQIGDGFTATRNITPISVTDSTMTGNVSEISAGLAHTCAVANNQGFCWGSNTNGRLGNNSTTLSSVPVAAQTSHIPDPPPQPNDWMWKSKYVSKVSAYSNHTCALAKGKVYCWGVNSSGQLGNGDTSNKNAPVPVYIGGVLNNKTVTDISAGGSHTCVIADGEAYCWGLNSSGQLGDGTTTQSNVPVAVNTDGVLDNKNVTSISAGSQHTCAVADGWGYCWGNGGNGRLGNNSTLSRTTPVSLYTTSSSSISNKTILSISAGGTHSCATTNDTGWPSQPYQTAFCWGDGTYGKLGNNYTTQRNSPYPVSVTSELSGKITTNISAGATHTCAVADGAAYCWGYNLTGMLGDGTTTQRNVPVAVVTSGVLGGKTVSEIHARGSSNGYTCAVASGASYCWGHNAYYKLGTGQTFSQTSVPAATDTSGELNNKTAHSLAAGTYHVCAAASLSAFCWGGNSIGPGITGLLGTNNVSSSVPYPVYADLIPSPLIIY